MDWFIGLAGSGLIAGAAYWKGSLSKSGVIAAILVGTLLYALGSLVWFGLMIGFFVTSTLLTKWKHHHKKDAESRYQKSGKRDAGQVMANGGIGALLCIAQAIWSQADLPLFAYIGVIATVTADTWATEVGGLSKGMPRSILTWKRVPKGTSGGISGIGWLAAAVGAGFIGVLAWLFSTWDMTANEVFTQNPCQPPWVWLIVGSLASGWIGANVDSVLGATVQALYRCQICGMDVEARRHCNQTAELIRGWSSMDNDAVNMISSLVGGLLFVGWSLVFDG